ncbi:protein disulfide-isomerase-like [Arapaima gigas]
MKPLRVFLLAAACLCCAFANDQEKSGTDAKPKKSSKVSIQEDKGVLILTRSNFDQALKQHKKVLVNFHVPLSGESQSLSLEFVKAAAQLKAESSKIRLAVVDVSKEKDLIKELNMTGIPSLIFYVTGDKWNPVICPDLRTAGHIITWLKRKTGHSAELIKDVNQAEAFLAAEDLVVLGFFKEFGNEKVETFYAAATDIPNLPFGVTKSKHVFKKYEITTEAVVLFKMNKKAEAYEISTEIKKEDLMQFIKVNEMDLVTEYNGTTSARILNSMVLSHAILFANKSDEDFDKNYGAFEMVAAEFKGKVLFVLINTDEHRNGRILEYFRVRYSETPMVRIVNLTDNVQYRMQSEEVTVDSVKAHCLAYLEGKAKPKLQSEPIPDNWDKGPVKELVGMNFEKVAFNDNKNVFVMFYAPWCKACQAFFPLWEKLGKVYEKHESVVIARIDSSANDIHVVLLERNPCFKFFPAVLSEKVVSYNGDRTLEAFTEFVEEQIHLAKDLKAMEEVEWTKYIEQQKLNENTKDEL